MSWRRFVLFLGLGILLTLGLAWGCQSRPAALPTGQSSSNETPSSAIKLDRIISLNGFHTESTATLPSLPPQTQAILASGPQGQVFSPPRQAIRLAVISDLNSAYGSTTYEPEVRKAIQLMPFWQPDLVLCSGDMVAGQSPSLSKQQIEAMWAAFDQQVAKPLRDAKLPYGFTLGNHDASSALGAKKTYLFQQERDLAAAYWNDPAHDPGVDFIDRQDFPFYYSFKYKDIFFLVWDGSSNHIPPEKLAWVEKTLASPEAQGAKMRILLGHLPLYAVAVKRNKPGEVMENADQLRALLEKYRVHTYISGHQHAYYPAHRGQLQLLHTGLLGSGPRQLLDSQLPPRKTLTILDVNFQNPDLTTYTTYDMKTLGLIDYGQLPRFIVGHNGIVLRRDIEPEELTPPERARCETRLGQRPCPV
ncbi:metallophosphoesterase [Synechocystis sp. LKSZ1]|uniref:metallophosphoesterase family protein n=1 Tax=Synechocystis sp. LKSZ1 TaxID=3144951 RepID=UPI00336C0A2D